MTWRVTRRPRSDIHAMNGIGQAIGSADPNEEEEMVKLVVCYGAPEDPAAFDRHYAETHVPLVEKIPHMRRFEAGKVVGTPDGSAAPFYYLAELSFDSAEDLQAAMGSAEGQAAGADVETFATGGVTMMIAEG